MRLLHGLAPLMVLLVLGGCGTDTTPAASSTGDEMVDAAEAPALDFTATTLEGEKFEGASLEGAPAVLWFWAPWCPTCFSQIPTVSGLGQDYAGRVNVVAVGGLDTQDAIEESAGRIKHVTHLVDDEGTVWKHFRVTAQSTFTVVDADGEIVHQGYLEDEELEELVADLAG